MYSILVNGVVFKDNKVLISQRSLEEKHMPGRWTIPGGRVEETGIDVFDVLQKTLVREVKEETGVDIEEHMELVTNNTFTRPSDGQNVIAIIFKCHYKSGEPQPLEDTIDCRWGSREEVEKMDFPPNVQGYILKAFEQ